MVWRFIKLADNFIFASALNNDDQCPPKSKAKISHATPML
jgi:hypothetical protein